MEEKCVNHRPIYENSNDLSNELRISQYLENCWKAKFVKMPISYHIDWAIVRDNEIKAFAEYKRRHNLKDRYETLMLSLNKWRNGRSLGADLGVPFFIIVEWDDGLYYYNTNIETPIYGFGGRLDREDLQDQEPVVFINTKLFCKVKENV
jgi:hypothetical protein